MQKAYEDLERAIIRLLGNVERMGPSAASGAEVPQEGKDHLALSRADTRQAAELVRRALSRLRSL